MQAGYLYIISHDTFGKNNYKLGYSYDNHKKLISRYHTYYITPIKIEATYLTSDKKLAEKLLFYKLRNYRIKKNKEFFCAELSLLKQECENVIKIINDDLQPNEIKNLNDLKIIEKYKKQCTEKEIKKSQLQQKRDSEKNKLYEEYKKIIINFINEQCDKNQMNTIRSSDLYREFKKWNKTDTYVDIKFFSPIVEDIGYVKLKVEKGIIFKGLEMKIKNDISNLIQQFIDDKIKITNNQKDFVFSSELYNEFTEYNSDKSKTINTMAFKEILVKKGFKWKRNKHGAGYIGIQLIETDNEELDE